MAKCLIGNSVILIPVLTIAETLAIIMKKLLFSFIFFNLTYSCVNFDNKSDFIGNWSTTSDLNTDINITFYNDSMVVDESYGYDTYSNKWEIKDSKIEQNLIRGDKSSLKLKHTNYYKFNLTKDTLFIKTEKDSIYHLKLTKIDNSYEYFQNKIGLQIKLKKTDEKLISIGKNDFGFNIYLGIKNGEIIAKTDSSENLNELTKESVAFMNNFDKTETKLMSYVLFIDKNVSNQKIDSIKSKINKEIIPKIFIVSDFREKKWNGIPEWLGNYEN